MYRIRIKEVAVPNVPSREVSWWKNVGKTGINFLHLMYNIVSASKMAGETKPLSWKKSWWACSQIFTSSTSTIKAQKRCEICLKLTIKSLQRHTTVFVVNFEQFTHFSSVSVADFEQKIVYWVFIWWTCSQICVSSKSTIKSQKRREICLKLTIKTLERHITVFVVNFEHISDLFLVFLWLTLNRKKVAGSQAINLWAMESYNTAIINRCNQLE